MRYAALVLVLAVLGVIFYVILQPQEIDPRLVEAWRKMTPSQRRSLAASRLPAEGRGLQDGRSTNPAGEDVLQVPKEWFILEWKELTAFPWQPGQPLPDSVRSYHGENVRLQGFMVAPGDAAEVVRFVLVPSPFRWSLGPIPSAREFVTVRMTSGKVLYTENLVNATGRFSVEEERVEGQTVGLYHLTAASVEEPALFPPSPHEEEEHE
ncbi:MAG: hypothetical protein HYU36_05520 [Planctomycetes bacterium]|nr:hypothetical protein [Planctomycetota bacterium]